MLMTGPSCPSQLHRVGSLRLLRMSEVDSLHLMPDALLSLPQIKAPCPVNPCLRQLRPWLAWVSCTEAPAF